jgi:nitrite reductase/ring-hydroxylating ferredoxin subunit
MATSDEATDWRPLVDLETLRSEGAVQKTVAGQSMAAFWQDGTVHVTDSRCPHMGFPLTEGTVDDGILTCHWHHARFELSCGDTFDPFADDVDTYPTRVRDGQVYVDPDPVRDASPEEHWRGRLEHGLREGLDLVVAKAVVGLDDADVPATEAVRLATEFGTTYRSDGWGRGLTTLGAMANLLGDVRSEDRRRALYVGVSAVADDTAGASPFFAQEPLGARDVSPEQLQRWFRHNVEVRDADGAERVLRTAIRAEVPPAEVAEMLYGAATDHLYLDSGHRLDFVNKAFETLEHVGWEHAEAVLPTLVPGLADASRAEESSSWREPIDVAALCFDAADELPALVAAGAEATWHEPDGFVDTLLGDDPHAVVDALTGAVADGASAADLAGVVATAAARRVAQFGTGNEFSDWNTVHHTYTYANAVEGGARRVDDPDVYRGVVDAAMNVYLDRFLNMPPAPLPDPGDEGRDPDAVLESLAECFEVERDEEVNRAGRLTAAFLEAGGDPATLKRELGRVLLSEDVGFHARQNVEAAFTQFDRREGERARLHLVATARYLAAHTPTRRASEQTFRIAERLGRGERIHEA